MDENFKSNCPVFSEGSNSSKNDSKKETASLVEILNNRLLVLEQESEKMKDVLVVCMDEKREISNEILQLLQTLRTETKHPSSYCQEIKRHNVGLLQALCEHSNPFLVMQSSTKSNIFC